MELQLTLPYPPSANRNVRQACGHFYTVPAVREYRQQVKYILRNAPAFTMPVSVAIMVYPPNRRKRDLDNVLKVLFDAIVRAKVLVDDSQVKRIALEWADVFEGGKVEMLMEEFATCRTT